MARTASDDALSRAAIGGSPGWARTTGEGPNPRRFPGLYDDGGPDADGDGDGDGDDLDWTSLR
ncbi:hypothetical protein LWC34_54425 [Kibdelosporangium philippinense]|uniref:Uncharacterized protein n=1 Tax=Kibdelosporangium philippinense TaxID=211113 RepID=A0ABS8ZX96_9PSEU|nr:hypothetical protein [Kibdelosporangium philippinense]MCE7011755.1 hypothetical protein [Kibdelosporangium philippinense]